MELIKDVHVKWLKNVQYFASKKPSVLLLHAPNNCKIEEFTLKVSCMYMCLNKKDFYCGSCKSCKWISENSHPDLVAVFSNDFDGKSKDNSHFLKIEEIHKLSDFFQLSSHQGSYKIAIIGPIENLTYTATNALLKTLEEPSASMKFIFFSHSLSKVPSTLVSRCQRINLTISAEELSKIEFNNCDIVPWLVPILKEGKKINPIECAKIAEKYSSYSIVSRMLSWMHDVFRVKYELNPISYTNDIEHLSEVSASIVDNKKWIESYFEILNMKRIATHPINTKLFLEALFIKFKDGFN